MRFRFRSSFMWSNLMFKDHWCFWLPSVTPELKILHDHVVALCAPLRSGPLVDYPETMTETEACMYERYGCWWVKEAWNPHLTLQVLRPNCAEAVAQEVCWPWRATSLALCRMGKFGSITEVVHHLAI